MTQNVRPSALLRKLPIFSEGHAGHITVETLLLTFTVAAESLRLQLDWYSLSFSAIL
jgi:hypothetical protein